MGRRSLVQTCKVFIGALGFALQPSMNHEPSNRLQSTHPVFGLVPVCNGTHSIMKHFQDPQSLLVEVNWNDFSLLSSFPLASSPFSFPTSMRGNVALLAWNFVPC
jgi:hypothetical protein